MKRTEQTITRNLSDALKSVDFSSGPIEPSGLLEFVQAVAPHVEEWAESFPDHYEAWVNTCFDSKSIIDPEKFWTERYRYRTVQMSFPDGFRQLDMTRRLNVMAFADLTTDDFGPFHSQEQHDRCMEFFVIAITEIQRVNETDSEAATLLASDVYNVACELFRQRGNKE